MTPLLTGFFIAEWYKKNPALVAGLSSWFELRNLSIW
jgi:hypothetical protein